MAIITVGKKLGKGRNHEATKPNMSERDQFLKDHFNKWISAGAVDKEEFHDFCRYAKGKTAIELNWDLRRKTK